ncbi:hypothetical protein [Flavobacterium branchiicola]|uniref:Uncharacterized protein n=1 Tax=Flavobacterium branchiicola TaxID=1114875 RepID=A0ABV9PJH8_9FLAO|nr:hypothetical protein [Flavobacterium branchiicola]MBS7255857.1 hypothetical protein [Flavobacterium branchiicola]
MNKYLTRLYNNIKDNLSMIALIPTLFGGIWQIIKLGNLSSNMIRFFSISQLLSDGILFLLIVVLPLIFTVPIILVEDENQIKSNDDVLEEKMDKDFLSIIIYIAGFILILFSLFQVPKYITIDNISSLVECISYMYMLLGILFFIMYKFITKDVFIHKLFFSSYAIIICCVTFISYSNISKNFNNISNFDHMINKLEKKERYSEKPKILYFNDKYIFIELVIKKNKKSILIKKIDDLFEE